jgi:hypothetical protein
LNDSAYSAENGKSIGLEAERRLGLGSTKSQQQNEEHLSENEPRHVGIQSVQQTGAAKSNV